MIHPSNYSIFESSYGNEYPIEQLYIHFFDKLPSKHVDYKIYSTDVVKFLELCGFKKESFFYYNHSKNDESDSSIQSLYVNKSKNFIIRTCNQQINSKTLQLEFYFFCQSGELEEQLDFNELKKYEKDKKKSHINLIKQRSGYLDTQNFDLKVPNLDLALNYGKKFLKVHDAIIKRLNKPYDKGIVLLHGEAGTGKTSYVKYIANFIQEKMVLFMPPSMAESLSEPSLIPFLMEHKNSILIIEDAEKVIADRETNGFSASVSNILNLTDGILSDCLNIQIIATFNMKKEKIDPALLRTGRLIAEHKFDKLDVDESNKLLKFLNKDYITKEAMTLSDIYNIDVEFFKTEKEKSKIGFI
jgi:hypothetical protein